MNQQTQHRIEPGYYRARAVRGTEQFVQADSGNEQVAIDFEVPALGRNLTVFFHFTDAAAPYAVEKLRACGWRGDDVTRLEGIDANEVELQVKYEEWKGRTRMKVDVATNGGGGRPQLENQLGEREKRAFAARVKALVGGGAPATASPRPAPPTGPRPSFSAQRQTPPAARGATGDQGFEPSDEIPF